MPDISSTTQELFRIWLAGCLQDERHSSTATAASSPTSASAAADNTTAHNAVSQQQQQQQQQQQGVSATLTDASVSTLPRNNVTGPPSANTSATTTDQHHAQQTRQIRLEAAAFFRSLVRDTTIITTTGQRLTTKASHQEALAVLIQQLGPAFTSKRIKCRVRALACLRGAVEGCRKEKAVLHFKLVQLLATFWQQHVGPLALSHDEHSSLTSDPRHRGGEDEHDDDEDVDEEAVRDEAMEGLCVLVSCRMGADPKDSSTIINMTTQMEELVQSIQICLSVAQTGVQRRCAEPDQTHDDDYDGYEDGHPMTQENAVAMGLSSLPRSRRSLCFQLLQAAVDAVDRIVRQATLTQDLELIDASTQASLLQDTMMPFVSFAARCLHGESDPRCLMQLLQLLHTTMKAWKPMFLSTPSTTTPLFPVSDVFDAVAPYYPIQFTPPPNDVFGITKSGLCDALMDVLCCCDYDETILAQQQQHFGTMMSMSLNLVLERLVPPPEDGPATLDDWKEGLQDLDRLLFAGTPWNIGILPIEQMHPLASALESVHQDASLAVLAKTGVEQQFAKKTADACRDLIAKVARETERLDPNLWKLFVSDTLSRLSTNMTATSSDSRIAIAYAACLCSSGGQQTMTRALQVGLNALLQQIDPVNYSMLDDTDLATAVYGVGAFFSSTRAALDKERQAGIHWHPHPLELYSSRAFERCHDLLSCKNVGTRIAAIRALESILVASPAVHFGSEQVEQMVTVLKSFGQEVLVNADMETREEEEDSEWKKACAQSLGLLLGKALDAPQEDQASSTLVTVLQAGPVKAFLDTQLLNNLVSSVGSAYSGERYEQHVFALASTSSLTAAQSAVLPLVEATKVALLKYNFDTAQTYAQALALVFQESASYASRAFQLLDAPNTSAMALRTLLSTAVAEHLGQQQTVSKEALEAAVDRALSIASLLQLAYARIALSHQVDSLVSTCIHSLPPLNSSDMIKCSVELCFLSAALSHSGLEISEEARQKLDGLDDQLLEFAIAPYHSRVARSYAVDCLYAVVLQFSSESENCRILSLIADKVMTRVHDLIANQSTLNSSHINELGDCLAIMGILGSVAAQRGGSSAATADQVMNFLTDLACTGTAMCTFTHYMETTIDLAAFEASSSSDLRSDLSLQAASALGLMFSTESGNRIWKQRLTHVATKRIQHSWKNTTELSNGMIAAVCHVVCGGNLRSIPASDLGGFVQALLRSLAPQNDHRPAAVPKLLLVSLLKILSVVPSALNDHAYHVITGAMRSYAAADNYESGDALACKLLSLQVLEAATHIVGALQVIQKSKAPVVSILGAAMNHPSGVLRQAAIHVRNTWMLVE